MTLLLSIFPGSRSLGAAASLHAQHVLAAAEVSLEKCPADAETGSFGSMGFPLDENDFPEFAKYASPAAPPAFSALSHMELAWSPEGLYGDILLPPQNHS
jgi:hypothetical protein